MSLMCDWCGALHEDDVDYSCCDCGREIDRMFTTPTGHPNPQSDMSETSETKWRGPFNVNTPDVCFQNETEILYVNKSRHAKKILAALNQPAACGPGLTEETRHAIGEAMCLLDERIQECLGNLDYDASARWRAAFNRLKDLLTRAAKADTVTLRREFVKTARQAFKYCELNRGDELLNSQLQPDILTEAIAEAEAALAAQGGEHANPE